MLSIHSFMTIKLKPLQFKKTANDFYISEFPSIPETIISKKSLKAWKFIPSFIQWGIHLYVQLLNLWTIEIHYTFATENALILGYTKPFYNFSLLFSTVFILLI